MKPTKLILLAGVALSIGGCWMPWIKIDEESLNGFLQKGDSSFGNNLIDFAGYLVIAIAVLTVFFSLVKRKGLNIAAMVLSLGMPIVSFVKFSTEKKLLADDGNDLQLGIGFWMILAGAIIIIAGNLTSLLRKK